MTTVLNESINKFKFIHVFADKCKLIKRKHLIGVGVAIVAVTGFSLMMYIKSPRDQFVSMQLKKSDTILRELGDINSQIQKISLNPSESKLAEAAFTKIQDDLAAIHQSVADIAKSSEIQKVSSEIELVRNDVDTQMGDIKKAVSESMGNKQYLEPSALPFQVVSVDMIGGQPYVSVNYEDHVSPLGVSDLLAGWRLTSADYDAGYAEFVNAKNNFVKVNLQG